MPQLKGVEVLTEGLADHCATLAWNGLRSGGRIPERTTVLKRERKSAVYRLEGVGPDRSSVIGKRSLRSGLDVEKTVYEDVLPRLPLARITYYGTVPDADPDYAWLFVEDLGRESFSPEDPEHRALVGRWVGRLHASGAGLEEARRLPDRGTDHYLEHVRIARRNLLQGEDNPVLGEEGREELRHVVAKLDRIESDWGRVEAAGRRLPETFVHGDLDPRNIRLRDGNGSASLVTFDWEVSGWGLPGVDLRFADLDAYREEIQGRFPGTDASTVRHWAAVGTLLRECIASLSWRSWFVAFRWAEEEVPCLVRYGERMAREFERLESAD